MKNLVICLVLSASSVYASDLNNLEELSLTSLLDIPVESSSSFDESLLTAPSSVAVINKDDWEKYGAKRPVDAISHLTGVTTYPDNVASGSTVRIRGYSNILPRGIAFILDDVPLNDYIFGTADLSYHQIGLGGLEKIELVKGPGSIKYGTDAFHGSMSLSTKEGYIDSNDIGIDLGTNNYMSATSTNTIVNKNYIVDFSIQGTKQGDQKRDFMYEDRITSQQKGDSREMKTEYYNTMLKVRSNTDSDFEYEIGMYLFGSDNEDFRGLGRLTGPTNNRNLGEYDRLNQDSNLNILQAKVNYNGLDNVSLGMSTFIWENDRTVKRYFIASSGSVLRQDQQLVQQRKGVKLTAVSNEAVLNTVWSASVGYDTTEVKKAHTQLYTTSGAFVKSFDEPYLGMNRKVYDLALEFKTTYDALHFNYGVRIDSYKAFGEQLSPRFAASYFYSASGVVKLIYGRAFRAGTAAEQASTTQTIGDPNIKPETIDSYEFVWLQNKKDIEIEASLFKTQWKNAIIRSIATSTPEFINRDENSAYGTEVNIKYMHSNNLDFHLGLSYVKSQSDTTNKEYVGYPEQTMDFGIGYLLSSDTSVYWSNRLMNKLSATSLENSQELPLYWQSDFHLDYKQSKKLSYALQVYNIFDRDNYISSLQLDPNGNLAQKMSIMLSAQYTF